jgi:phage terminase large subunit-like protein
VLKDPTTYGVVFAAEKDDDPFVEATWRKANPGYGVSPTKRYMADAAKKARRIRPSWPGSSGCTWGSADEAGDPVLEVEEWDVNASIVDVSRLKGRKCFGGLDLGSTSDLTALAWVFPDADAFDVLVRCWAPEDSIEYLDDRTANAASRG